MNVKSAATTVAASGGMLLDRVRRILGASPAHNSAHRSSRGPWLAGIASLGLVLAIAAGSRISSEEELAIFDLLTQPEPELTEKEKDEVKKVAKDMLAKLKAEKLVLDWKLKTRTKADVERTIRDFYIRLPGAYTPELKKEKRAKTYAHIYENYFGAGLSVYQGVGVAAH